MSYKSSLTVLWLIAATVCVSALAGCTTLSVGSDYDRAASFAGLRTFSLMQREHHDVHNPLVATRAQDAIRAELIRKGYQPAADPSTADFSVDFTIGSKERTDVNAYPDPYLGAGWGWGHRSDIQNSEAPIRKAVAAVLAKFPPV